MWKFARAEWEMISTFAFPFNFIHFNRRHKVSIYVTPRYLSWIHLGNLKDAGQWKQWESGAKNFVTRANIDFHWTKKRKYPRQFYSFSNSYDQSRQMLICHGNLSSSRNLRGRGNFYEGIELPVLTCHHAGNKSPRLYTSFAAVVVVVVVVVVVHRETRDSIILARVYVLTFRAWAKGKFDEKTEKLWIRTRYVSFRENCTNLRPVSL